MPRSKICCQCLRTGALRTYNHAIQQGFIIGRPRKSDGYFTRQCSRGNSKSMTRMLTSDFNMQSLLREKNEIAKLCCSTDGKMLMIMRHSLPTGVLLCAERHADCGTHNLSEDVSCFMHNNNISSVGLPVIAHADRFIVPVNVVLFMGRGIPHLSFRVLP